MDVVGADSRFYSISPEALREARRARLWTQRRLAEVSGVYVSTISQIENGARERIRALTLARLSKALDMAPDKLLVEAESGEERE